MVKTGRMEAITANDVMMNPVQAETYNWDVLGNLTARTWQGGVNTLTESFEYDKLNRLTRAGILIKKQDNTTQTLTPQSVTYDALGNITNKSDVGHYTYGARPHAVIQAGGDTCTYDKNGNRFAGGMRIPANVNADSGLS